MTYPAYREAVHWIAHNDSPADGPDLVGIAGYLTTLLVADVWHRDPAQVARDVARVRRRIGDAQ